MSISPFFWERKKNKPGLNYKVELRKSNIPNAGEGLFTLEFIPKNSIFKTINNFIHVDDYIKLALNNYQESIKRNYIIFFDNINDIEKLVTYFDSYKILSKSYIRKYMSWFMAIKNNKIYLNSYSNHLNSSKNNNLYYENINNILHVKTNKNIEIGQELLFNYQLYEKCDFYEDWLLKYNLKNVKELIN